MTEEKSLEARLEFFFSDSTQAQNALLALEPDLNRRHEKRSQTVLKANKKVLLANISASDEKALKSGIQFLFKSVSLVQRVQNSL